MAGIDDIGRIREIVNAIRSNIATKPGRVYYVNAATGNNSYDGLSRDHPVLTINTAIGLAGHGDIIHIARGTYDEAVSIPAGRIGLQIICEPGVYIVNTDPGTVVAIASACVYWEGGIIETNGQIGMQVNDDWFIGKDIRAYNCSVGFDMNGIRPLLINCRVNEPGNTGFDISNYEGFYIDCICQGSVGCRGFYLSNANAMANIFVRCVTQSCSVGGYVTVAFAGGNVFKDCSQSSLCAGPIDAGGNNTWANHYPHQVRHQSTTQATTNALAVLGTAIESTVPFRVSGCLSLHNMQAGDTFLVIEEIRDQDDASYREYARNSYSDVQVSPLIWFEPKVCQGWRIRIQRTAGADRNVTYQYFKEVE